MLVNELNTKVFVWRGEFDFQGNKFGEIHRNFYLRVLITWSKG